MIGKSLSHYKILEELGRGGMGIVYKAEDTKLDRTVAIKVLPSAALGSDDDRARFYREAKAAAQLHHPHIAGVFEIDEAVPEGSKDDDLRPFIAMEYIEGKTLEELIAEGPLKVKDCVRVASEIASGLKAAHDKDIVHRDIKAANIILDPSGSAKILDFGLAQTAKSTRLTHLGSTLGTIAFMSPEQARGEPVDQRSDLWSLGVVLYEMVAGRSPFPGDYEQAVVYEILNQNPEPLTALRTGVPMELEGVVDKCLAKDPDLRYPSADGLIVDLKRIEASSAVRTTSVTTQVMPAAMIASSQTKTVTRPWALLAVVGVAMLLAGILLGNILFDEEPVVRPASKTHLNLPGAVSPLQAAITPDDRSLFFVTVDSTDGSRRLARYDFDTGAQSFLPQTDNALFPIASPDGRWVAFRRGGTDQWWRIAVSGGDPLEIPGALSAASARATYAPNGDLVFSDSSWSIAAVNVAGVVRFIASGGPDGLGFPSASPSGDFITWNDFRGWTPVATWMLRGGDSEPVKLMDGTWIRALTTSGHALFTRGAVNVPQQTIAVPIDLGSGEVRGQEAPIGVWSYAVSPSGLLVYEDLSGQERTQPSDLYRVLPSGGREHMFALPGVQSQEIAISSDGSKLAVGTRAEVGDDFDMYIIDVDLGTSTRLTRGGTYDVPTWGPNDEYLYFDYTVPGANDWTIMRRKADGSGTNEIVLPEGVGGGDPDITSDNRLIVFSSNEDDVWGYDMVADSAFAIVVDNVIQFKTDASPDGKFVVYVQDGNASCGSVQVSAIRGLSEPIELESFGCYPVWTQKGDYIYFQDESSVSRVPVSTEPVFGILGAPEVMYRAQINRAVGLSGALFFDVAADGTLYVSHADVAINEMHLIWVVHDWFEELNRIAPRSE